MISFKGRQSRLLTIAWVAMVLYAALVTYLSLATFDPDIDRDISYLDKVVHCCFYLGFNFLVINLLSRYRERLISKDIVVATIISLSYSLVIEAVQPLFNRSCDGSDIVANGAGTLLGIVAFKLIGEWINRLLERV